MSARRTLLILALVAAPVLLRAQAPPFIITTPSPLPAGVTGSPYVQELQASGGTLPYTWSLAAGSALPSGLDLTGSTIGGTPAAPGVFTFTLRVADSEGGVATKDFSLSIVGSIVPGGLAIITSSLPTGTVSVPYSQDLAASGGTPPYTWSLASGSLPAGLSLIPAGTISGTPTASGSSTFTIGVADSTGATSTRVLTIIAVAGALVVSTSTLPPSTQNAPYSQTLEATGGTPPYAWSVAGGALPAGINLTAAGVLIGTPSASGTFGFTVQVRDSLGVTAMRPLTLAVAAPLEIVTASLASGTVSGAYSQTLSARGGSPPYAWAVQSGALPAGLQLSPAGVLSGTPTESGTFTAAIRVTDVAGASTSHTYTIGITPALAIAPVPALVATAGAPYTRTLTASGGTPPYTWSVSAGALPAGMTLEAGVLGGTPGASGMFAFTARVADAAGAAATLAVNLSVNPRLAIVTEAAVRGIAGVPYSQTIASSGGTPPVAWAVASGTLPPGLALNGTSIQGTPTASGAFPFTLRATDANGATATREFSITIAPGLSITTTSLPNATAGAPYSQTVAATGGAGPYAFSVGGGALPGGLTLNPTTGAISGTPGGAGSASFNVKVTDATGVSVSRDFTVTVAPALSVSTESLPNGALSSAYSQTVAAAGGNSPYTWAVSAGQLPPGLSLNPSGALSGTPLQNGDFNFTVRVIDAAGAAAVRAFAIQIGPGLAITAASPLPAAVVGSAYSQTLTAIGGVPPYRWAVAPGSALPPGLALDAGTGAISGTPLAPGATSFTMQVTDSASRTVSRTLSLTIGSDLAIQTPSLPSAVAGAPYSQALVASGGRPPYTWTLAAGASLPAGITLDPNGVIHGVPSQPGPRTFTAVVTDSASAQASKPLTLTVTSGLTVATSDLPAGALSAPYNQPLTATGGTLPYKWAVTGGALPAGIVLNSATGVLSGTPAVPGAFQFTIQVTDAVQVNATRPYSLNIVPAPLPAVTVDGAPETGQPLDQSNVQITLAGPFPADINGQVVLAFNSSATVPADDRAIAFANGQRTIAFQIPAGQTQAQFPEGATAPFQNGTVAGAITVTVIMQSAGVPLAPAPAPRQVTIAPAAPVIRNVRVVRTASGFEVWTTGFSTTRELTEAVFAFDPAAGGDLRTNQLTLPVGPAAQAWYQDPNSSQWGSQFTVVQPFTIQGAAGAIGAVSVTLRNAQGTSAPVKAPF